VRFTPALAAACLLATLILAVQQSYQESESFHSRPDAPANGHSLRVPENYRYLCKIMVRPIVQVGYGGGRRRSYFYDNVYQVALSDVRIVP
jgi:hypothetical protein